MEHSVLLSSQQNRNPAKSLQENSITLFGPRLYNSLAKYQIDVVKIKKIKLLELHNFLELIPDDPKLLNYVAAARINSVGIFTAYAYSYKRIYIINPNC